MTQKKCNKCKEWKSLDCFHKCKSNKDGLQYKCKECRKAKKKKRDKKYYEKKRIKEIKRKKLYLYSPIKFNSKGKMRQEIEIYEEVRESTEGFLECKCAYCGSWFEPTYKNIYHRLRSMITENMGECRFYCSEKCKQACPIFKKILYSADQAIATSREVQPELRQMVLSRDNYTCQRCNKHKDELDVALHCHHLEGILWEPLESADIDQCITYCAVCHVKAHQQTDCGYHDMKCA